MTVYNMCTVHNQHDILAQTFRIGMTKTTNLSVSDFNPGPDFGCPLFRQKASYGYTCIMLFEAFRLDEKENIKRVIKQLQRTRRD